MRRIFSNILLGKMDELDKIFDGISRGSNQEYFSPFLIAVTYLNFGQKVLAFEWLERAYRERDHWLIALKVDPKMDSVRSDPRFQALLEKVGLDKYAAPTL